MTNHPLDGNMIAAGEYYDRAPCHHCYGRSSNDRCLECGSYLGQEDTGVDGLEQDDPDEDDYRQVTGKHEEWDR